jgi:hypothetical protein
MAQRGGGGHGGGAVGGIHGGGGAIGGFRGGGIGGLRGGFGYGGYGYGGFYGGFYGYPYWPGWGFGYSYWPGYYDYGYYPYTYDPNVYYPYSYDPSPNTTVIYPAPAQAAPGAASTERANPVVRQYDEYGQEIKSSTSGGAAIYLLAFSDHSIRAAAAYWVDGKTLHYVTLQKELREAPLDTVDRDFSQQLNRERHVPFSLPVP